MEVTHITVSLANYKVRIHELANTSVYNRYIILLILIMTTQYVKRNFVKSLFINGQDVQCEIKCQVSSIMTTPKVKKHFTKSVMIIIPQYLMIVFYQDVISSLICYKNCVPFELLIL